MLKPNVTKYILSRSLINFASNNCVVSYAVCHGAPTAAQLFLDTQLRAVAGGRAERDVPLPDLLYHCMREHPQNIHMINGATNESFTNEQILRRAVSLARALLSRRLTARVLMCVMRNREELITLYYGAFFAGVQVFLLDPQSTLLELNHFLTIVEPSLVVCDADRVDDVRGAVRQYGGLPVDAVIAHDQLQLFASGHDDNPDSFKPVEVSPEACAVLLPTSGSTGLAKAAKITHAGLQAQLPSLWRYDEQFPRPTERLMFMSTAQWMTFTNFLTSCPVYHITLIVTPDKTMPTILRIIETHKPTWLLLVPGTAAMLAEAARAEQLTSLQRVVLTGAAPAPAVLRRLQTLVPQAHVLNSYGMTETMGFVAISNKNQPFCSIGKIFNIFQYKFVDDDEKEVARGEKGQLYLKSDCIIKCYVKNESAYRECSAPGGWWRTGDVFTEDDQHQLTFVERKRFWFKHLNYHISPEEMEAVISGVPGVLEVVVADSSRGAAAAVVRRSGVHLTREHIHDTVNNALIEYKRLRGGIAFVENLPRTHSGKLHRSDCARMIQQLVDSGECH